MPAATAELLATEASLKLGVKQPEASCDNKNQVSASLLSWVRKQSKEDYTS